MELQHDSFDGYYEKVELLEDDEMFGAFAQIRRSRSGNVPPTPGSYTQCQRPRW